MLFCYDAAAMGVSPEVRPICVTVRLRLFRESEGTRECHESAMSSIRE